MNGKKARFGFIGAGDFISMTHLVTAGNCPFIEIRAISDLNRDALAHYAEIYKVGYTSCDYKKLLADPEIDIVVIGTKQDLHARMIIESLDAGKWVFCEKPMCDSREEEAAILAAEHRNPGRLAIGFNRRFAPAYVKALEVIRNRPRPWQVLYRMNANIDTSKKQGGYYISRPHIIFEGCHILDLASYLFGEAPCRVFMASGDSMILQYPDGSNFTFAMPARGSGLLPKESMELFAESTAITVTDFIDLRIRGVAGEKDMLFPPRFEEHWPQIKQWGFDYYEMFVYRDLKNGDMKKWPERYPSEIWPEVVRPMSPLPFRIGGNEIRDHREVWTITPDKGWRDSIEHFARCFLDGTLPRNADGAAGKRANDLGYALLESARLHQSVEYSEK